MTTAAISTVGLEKSFGQTRALDGLDLQVETGEVHGFLGPNRAGKTTTLRILLGLLRADAGEAQLLWTATRGGMRLACIGAWLSCRVMWSFGPTSRAGKRSIFSRGCAAGSTASGATSCVSASISPLRRRDGSTPRATGSRAP